MGMYQPLHEHGHSPPSSSPATSVSAGYVIPKAVFTGLLCAALCLSLLHLLCCGLPRERESVVSRLQHNSAVLSDQGGGSGCDYSEGQWVREPGHARRYNGTECNVTGSENCVRNGRPDTGYLDWRWQPSAAAGAGCHLPPFDAAAFLAAVCGKHVAFVGDSMARSQAESLVCLLGASSFPRPLVHRSRKLRRWAFPSHNVTVSSYWAPFLARVATTASEEEERGVRYNSVYLDALADDHWSADAGTMDVAVISTGHWFWDRAVYYNGSDVLGARVLEKFNHTRIGFFSPYREAIRMSIERFMSSGQGAAAGRGRTVVVTTVSPAHFEKAWDDPATCARKEPYKDGEVEVASMAAELRKIARGEVSAAAATRNGGETTTKVKVLDVTKLATMRPDGHPGVYTHRDPFARGVPERLKSDCLHFCLPGPVDTFNEILLQLLTERHTI